MHQKADSIRRASSNEVHFISSSGAPGMVKEIWGFRRMEAEKKIDSTWGRLGGKCGTGC